MRKVYVTATINFILTMDEGVELTTAMNEISENLNDAALLSDNGSIESVEMMNHEVTDSK